VENDVESPSADASAPLRGPIGGLFHSIAKLLATAIGIAHTRLELLTTELQEEVHRVAEIILYAAVALISAGVGLFLLSLLVVIVFWDTHRIAAAIGVTGTFLLIAVVAALVLRAKVRAKPAMLNATLAELKKDRASLLSRRS
jgi:uncharacterized membrane protein YqjE